MPLLAGDDVAVVEGIGELGQAGEAAAARRCRAGRGLHGQRLVRAVGVEFLDEGVEAGLLAEAVRGGGAGGLLLEGQVHALVAAVLLRLARGDALERDAEPEPPDREPRQAVEPAAGEGHPVVGADRGRQAALLEQPVKGGENRGFRRPLQRLDHQDEARGLVGDGERVAEPPVAEPELALEVAAPEVVRRRGLREGRARGAEPPGAGVLDQAVAVEHRVDRRARRQRTSGPSRRASSSRSLRAPQFGFSRFSATIAASTGIGSRLAMRPGRRGRSASASSPCSL